MNLMSKTGGYDIQSCIKEMDRQMQDYPVHVPSERPGGHSRRELMKQRAATISRSAAEAFAFSTSTTLSQEDTDTFLQAFGNVIQSIYVVNSTFGIFDTYSTHGFLFLYICYTWYI